ncbi:hypothetical protein ACPCW1_19040, partial [Bacillus pumilus]|uniref:hypothetical protein n=1 Tax=Bacillus pumilus TaxID=1408 RepID=UPI003C1334B0
INDLAKNTIAHVMSLLIHFPSSYHNNEQKRKQDKRTPLVAHPAPAEEMLMLSFDMPFEFSSY